MGIDQERVARILGSEPEPLAKSTHPYAELARQVPHPGDRFVAIPVLPDLLAALEKHHGPRALDAAARDRLKILVCKAVAQYVAAPQRNEQPSGG